MTALALCLYGVLLAAAVAAVWRKPGVALFLFVVGLPLHNLVLALLVGAGIRGGALDAIAAWKEIVLGAAVLSVAVTAIRRRELPFAPAAIDALALAFAAVVVLYALIPQSALGGSAGAKAVLYGLRHDLAFVAAYLLGRAVRPPLAAVLRTVLAAAAAVAVWGLIDAYAVSLDWWRHSGAAEWYRNELGFDYRGLSGLPENFIYNTGNELNPLRRLVSTFLSPLATGYLLVVALLLAAARPRSRFTLAVSAVSAAGLAWTFSRSSWLALAFGLCVLAFARRRVWPVAAAAAVLAIGFGFTKAYPHIGPATSFTPTELAYQREQSKLHPGASHDPTSANESSISSHWRNLRDGVESIGRHPQGYGVGNAGATASRFGVQLKAGESNYTELGAEVGVAGLALFLAFALGLLVSLVRAGRAGSAGAAATAAALAAVLALAIQTDVIGVPWIAYCVFWLGGSLAAPAALRSAAQSSATVRPARPPTAGG